MKKFWIQKAIKHKGSLSRQLGIPQEEIIPKSLLNEIIKAKAGQTIINPTNIGKKRIVVTRLMERRAILAKTLRKF